MCKIQEWKFGVQFLHPLFRCPDNSSCQKSLNKKRLNNFDVVLLTLVKLVDEDFAKKKEGKCQGAAPPIVLGKNNKFVFFMMMKR